MSGDEKGKKNKKDLPENKKDRDVTFLCLNLLLLTPHQYRYMFVFTCFCFFSFAFISLVIPIRLKRHKHTFHTISQSVSFVAFLFCTSGGQAVVVQVYVAKAHARTRSLRRPSKRCYGVFGIFPGPWSHIIPQRSAPAEGRR